MWEWLNTIPSIIEAATRSPLGIIVLIIVILGIIGITFFRRAPLRHKTGIYILMFVGFPLFLLFVHFFIPDLLDFPRSGSKLMNNPGTQPQNRSDQAGALLTLGIEELKRGHTDQARIAFIKARSIYKANSHPLGEAAVSIELGQLEAQLGRNAQALKALTEAHAIYEAADDRLGQANALLGIGGLEDGMGRHEQARRVLIEARALYKAINHRLGEANVLPYSGRTRAESQSLRTSAHGSY